MEQFSLDKWLQDKSRKIVTRSGVEAEIIHDKYPLVAIINGVAYNFDNDGKFQSNRAKHQYDLFFADEEEGLTELQKTLEEDCDCYVNLYNDGKTREELREWIKAWCPRIIDLARNEFEKENSEFKPKFTYNEKDYSELANKLIEFRNNTPLCSVSYRDGDGRKVILHYEKEILELARKELEANYYTKVIDDRMVFKSELHEQSLQTAYDMGKQDVLKDLPKWKKITEEEQNYLAYGYLSYDGYYLSIQELKDKLPKEE